MNFAFVRVNVRQAELKKLAHKSFFLLLVLFTIQIPALAQQPQRAQVTILSTTDTHGNILPLDYYTNKPDARGLAKAATVIKQARKQEPNLLLLDSGDTIQGTPLVYYHNRKNDAPPDPMMLVMNALKYDAMAVGNHEFNFGLNVLEKARREASFPWISANIYDTATKQTHLCSHCILAFSQNGVSETIWIMSLLQNGGNGGPCPFVWQ
jgi:2',3'-cyclic-nucleotide 2'-phosphodiesterase/3'-nucleotidase